MAARWPYLLWVLPWLSVHCATREGTKPRIVLHAGPGLSQDEASRYSAAIHAEVNDLVELASPSAGNPSPSGDGCHVYVNANPEGLQVRFEEPNGQPLGPPRTLESQGELGAQEVATIVRNVLLAQRESLPTAATARDKAPETAPESEALKRAHVGALYTGTTYAPEVPWFHGPNLMGTFRIHRRLFVGVDYGYHLPRQASKGDIMVQVTQHRLRAFVGGEVPWHSVFLGGDVGVAALGTTRTTQSLATDLQATPETTRWLAAFSATARLRWPLPPFPRTSFLVAPALEWVPAATPMVALGASELVVVDPHLFRFRGDVGVLFELF